MPGQSVWPGWAFTCQNLKFTGQLSDDWLLFAGLGLVVQTNLIAHCALFLQSEQ